MDYLNPQPGGADTGAMSALALAHMGDAVYELMVRAWLCRRGGLTAANLHKRTVGFVSAPAQAAAYEKIVPMLTQAETDVFRRGRNAKSHAAPKGASVGEYHTATGFEALFGKLYLDGETERLNTLFARVMEE